MDDYSGIVDVLFIIVWNCFCYVAFFNAPIVDNFSQFCQCSESLINKGFQAFQQSGFAYCLSKENNVKP